MTFFSIPYRARSVFASSPRAERIGSDAGGVFGPEMVRAIDALVRCERGFAESKRICGAVRSEAALIVSVDGFFESRAVKG